MAKQIKRWDPFKEITTLRDEMDRLFEYFFGRPSMEPVSGVWVPAVDMEETDDELIVHIELPGMKKEDINLSVRGDVLTVSGEREHKKEEKTKTYHRIERAYGKFQRSIPLPVEVDTEKSKATYENGILTVRLPKSAKSKSKEIKIT